MGGSAGKSESSNDAVFSQDVWGPQGDALKQLYGAVGSLFNQTNSGMQGQIPGSAQYMNQVRDQSNPAWQQQMQGGAYKDMDLQGMYQQALGGGGNEQFMNEQIMGGAGNDYADAMKGQIMDNASDAQNTLLGNLDARAAASGMSGGSRHGVATARGMDDINQTAQNQLTDIGYNTFDKDQDRKMSIAQNADMYDMQKLNNVSGMIGQKQNAMSGGLNYGQNMQNLGMGVFAPYMAPWQAAGAYSNSLGSPTVLGSGTMSGDSKGLSASGGIGGGK